MDTTLSKHKLKLLVAQGEKEIVVQHLLQLADSQPEQVCNLIYSLSAHFNSFKKNKAFGTLSAESEKQLANELTLRMLTIIDALDPEVSDAEAQPTHPPATPKTAPVQPDFSPTEKKAPPPETAIPIPADTNGKHRDLPIPTVSRRLVLGIALSGLFLAVVAYLLWWEPTVVDPIDSWSGVWQQQIEEADHDAVTSGEIVFSRSGNDLQGKVTMIYSSQQESSTTTLSDIEIAEDGRVLRGTWQHDQIPSLKGAFEFRRGPDSPEGPTFQGTHHIAGQSDQQYFWNGLKKSD